MAEMETLRGCHQLADEFLRFRELGLFVDSEIVCDDDDDDSKRRSFTFHSLLLHSLGAGDWPEAASSSEGRCCFGQSQFEHGFVFHMPHVNRNTVAGFLSVLYCGEMRGSRSECESVHHLFEAFLGGNRRLTSTADNDVSDAMFTLELTTSAVNDESADVAAVNQRPSNDIASISSPDAVIVRGAEMSAINCHVLQQSAKVNGDAKPPNANNRTIASAAENILHCNVYDIRHLCKPILNGGSSQQLSSTGESSCEQLTLIVPDFDDENNDVVMLNGGDIESDALNNNSIDFADGDRLSKLKSVVIVAAKERRVSRTGRLHRRFSSFKNTKRIRNSVKTVGRKINDVASKSRGAARSRVLSRLAEDVSAAVRDDPLADDELLRCKFCGQSFARRANLTHHISTIHMQVKPFKCPVVGCSYSTSHRGVLNAHQRTHTGEKPFACEYQNCDYRSSRKSHLLSHQRTHAGLTWETDAVEYLCDQCSFKTARKSTLTTHQVSHNDERKWACTCCDSAFKYAKGLNRHVKQMHTGENQPVVSTFSSATPMEVMNSKVNSQKRNVERKPHRKMSGPKKIWKADDVGATARETMSVDEDDVQLENDLLQTSELGAIDLSEEFRSLGSVQFESPDLLPGPVYHLENVIILSTQDLELSLSPDVLVFTD